ncbi:MAG: copper amine oxidase N-terminal domain-containing protein [Candidatus Pristimantibacillus sp.]
MKSRLLLIGLVAAVMLLPTPSYTVNAASAEAVDRNIYDGKLQNGRVFAPLRSIGEKLDAKVTWSSQNKTATVTKDGVTLEVKVGSKDMVVGDRIIHMDVTPQVEKGRTYLPLRYIGEAFGYNVNWYKNSRIAYLEDRVVPNIGVYAQPIIDTEGYELLNGAISKAENMSNSSQKRAYLKPYFTDTMINSLIREGGLKPTVRFQDAASNMYFYPSDITMRINREVFNGAGYDTEESLLVKQGDHWLVSSIKYGFDEMRP